MPLPRWDDPDFKVGTMVKGALWLVQQVGEGNIFTKEQIRQAFPGISQADRRIRDLRDFGWVIHTNTDDARLMAEDQRFVKQGVPVWDPSARRAAAPKTVSAKERHLALERDDYMCTVCGISGGDPYPDDSTKTAVLSVTRRTTVMPSGEKETLLVTECKRCRAGDAKGVADAAEVLAAIQTLDAGEQRRLLRWMQRGRRGSTSLDRAWNAFRRLPADARDEIQRSLLD